MHPLIEKLVNKTTLSEQEAYELMFDVHHNQCNEIELSIFINTFQQRSIYIDEMKGFRKALMDTCIPMQYEDNLVDIVGTGGDGKNSFNISTTAAFVIAGAGLKVAKHGNYNFSSKVGSSNLLEQLGYKFPDNAAKIYTELDSIGISFIHAPLFHPTIKKFSNIRKQIRQRTFLNNLGPICNPIDPKVKVIGVSQLKMGRDFHLLFQNSKYNYAIVYSHDGFDELSLTRHSTVWNRNGEDNIPWQQFSKHQLQEEELAIHHESDAKTIVLNILQNKSTVAQKNVVLANAALAIYTAKSAATLQAAYQLAQESIDSGNAYLKLKQLMQS